MGDRVDDVASTAWSVASWTWAGGGSLDHGFQAQSRRGAASAKVRRYRVVERDRATVARLDAGQTQRGASEDLDVAHILRREKTHLDRRQGLYFMQSWASCTSGKGR